MARRPGFSFYVVMALAVALDQATKAWATAALKPVESVVVVPGLLNLTYNLNTGVAFGMFAGQGLIVVLLVIALAVAVICNIQDLNWAGWEPNLVGGCLCGGALGNLADRLRSGYVVDFIDAHAGAHHWPIFNMADSLICVSVGWILVRQFWGKKRGTTA